MYIGMAVLPLALHFCLSHGISHNFLKILVVGLATLSLFRPSVYMSKAKMAFFRGLAFSSQPEIFEMALEKVQTS